MMPSHLNRVGWRESKPLYEALSFGQILGSVCSSSALVHVLQFISFRAYSDTTTFGPSALKGVRNQATKMRKKSEAVG